MVGGVVVLDTPTLDTLNGRGRLLTKAVSPIWCEVETSAIQPHNLLTEWRVDQHRIVEIGRRRGNTHGLHLLEASKRVTVGYQLADRTPVQRAGNEQHDVVNHVAVRHVVEKCGERRHRMAAHVTKFDDEQLLHLVVDCRHAERRRLVL